jgi:hypothetical protein
MASAERPLPEQVHSAPDVRWGALAEFGKQRGMAHRPGKSRSLLLPEHRHPANGAIPVAQKVQTLYIDDIDGGEAAGTVRFGLDGADYEIDLSAEHTDELHTALRTYIDHARKVGGTSRRAPRSRRAGSAIDTTAVRTWAREQGIDIKDRGRVPADIVAKYEAASGR